ncbi:MAG: Fe-S protein assembly co-chaperone HscB [Gammaproteobacteria bacterium]|nr:Fe-S protein assembly co-chaperone HscB [Gammaproteobacteria bacterium]
MADNTPNYFTLFDLPVSFHVDTELLAQRFRELQRNAHPDRVANGSDRERRLAVQQAALINQAYQTLRSPLLRGRYLLELQGEVFNDETATTVDSAFLMEQMHWRETLGELREQADPLDVVHKLLDAIRTRQTQLENDLATYVNQARWSEAKVLVYKLQFLQRIYQEAELTEGELLDIH